MFFYMFSEYSLLITISFVFLRILGIYFFIYDVCFAWEFVKGVEDVKIIRLQFQRENILFFGESGVVRGFLEKAILRDEGDGRGVLQSEGRGIEMDC